MTARRRVAAVLALLASAALVAGAPGAPDGVGTGGVAPGDAVAGDAVAGENGPGDADRPAARPQGSAAGAAPPAAAQPNGSAVFDETIVVTNRGEFALVPVSLDGTDEAKLSVGGPEVNYRVNATLHDRDGDGRVLVLFDTDVAGLSGRTISTRGDADAATVTRETSLERAIEPADYPMVLFVDGVETGIATLIVEERRPLTATPDTETPTGTPGTVTPGGTPTAATGDASLPADPAILVLVGVAIGGLGVALGSRLVGE